MDSDEKKPEEEIEVENTIKSEEKPEIKEPVSQDTRKVKSENTKLIIALMIVIGIAGYFSGSFFSNPDSELVTETELAEALSDLESRIGAGQQMPPQPVEISLDDDPIRGDPDAPITIVEFSDFQCPFCARFHVQTLPSLLEEYIDAGKVNLVYRDFPIQSIHPNALPAAVAAECAHEQGKYWEYHDTLFEKQSDWSRLDSNSAIVAFSQFATDVGVDKQQFDTCLETGKYLEEVQGDLSDGRDYDVTGTPAFFIGNEKLGFVKLNGAQPFDSFQKVIDAQLEA